MDKKITKATLGRLPLYLSYIKSLPEGAEILSSTSMSKALGLGEVQVRKDLGQVSKSGKPKVGFKVNELLEDFEEILGVKEKTNAVIVGTGKLGKALIDYEGFSTFGIDIVASFDTKVDNAKSFGKINIYPMDEMKRIIKEYKVVIGVITVPKNQAQSVADILVEDGVKAIWNFAQVNLTVPSNIIVQQENLALSIAHISSKLKFLNK